MVLILPLEYVIFNRLAILIVNINHVVPADCLHELISQTEEANAHDNKYLDPLMMYK
jgi:hypothetical protein